ncbi:MAG: P-type conjugative transfer protein TrbL [Sulfuricurvum sp.]|uniref:P-type conjugative transfer protein TrbL n=1 Tax=Sulfuricurvum sp. TaxID=2025608 RepID=UPI00260313FA|nr:P-type conjugative transfer protein TrbL [Sulfuricurvum sp.]MDD5159088.1 P-type conjugative transfer protein TrbL [Sulfuricurvum sp.]
MKRLIIFFGLLLPGFLYGAIDPAASHGDTLLASFEAASTHWRSVIVPAAMWVFGALITIDLVIEFGKIAMSGKVDFSDFIPPLIQKTLIIGFFMMLFQYSDWLATIPDSFAKLGDQASGETVDPDNIIANALKIVLSLMEGLSVYHLIDSITLFFSAIIILIAFGLMAAHLIMAYIKSYVMLALAPLVFSLAGLTQTRQMAYNPIFANIKVGAEILLLKLFLGLSITMMHDFAAHVDNDNGSIFVMIIMSIVMASVVHMSSGIVEALFSGTVAQTSTAGLGTAAAVAGGMAAGAMGAAKGAAGMGAAVKAASNLAKEQRAGGDSSASTMKNLKSAFKDDFKRSMSGENHGGTMGGRMAFKNSTDSIGTTRDKFRKDLADKSEKTQAQNAVNATRNEEDAQQAAYNKG